MNFQSPSNYLCSLKKKILSLAVLLIYGTASLSLLASSTLATEQEHLLPAASGSSSYGSQRSIQVQEEDLEEESEGSEISPAKPLAQIPQEVSRPEEQSNNPQTNNFSLGWPLTGNTENVLTLKHITVTPEVKPEDESYLLQQIGLISSTLKLVEVCVLQEPEVAAESAEVSSHTLEEAGDIRHGLFILLESLRRPHRYHARFYAFDAAKYGRHLKSLKGQIMAESSQAMNEIFLTEHQSMTRFLRKMFRTPAGLDLRLEGCLLTRSKPNKLFLSFEEEDTRCGGRINDFFGKLYSKFENDPLAAVSLLAGGASRIAKAVMTNGASELANLTQ